MSLPGQTLHSKLRRTVTEKLLSSQNSQQMNKTNNHHVHVSTADRNDSVACRAFYFYIFTKMHSDGMLFIFKFIERIVGCHLHSLWHAMCVIAVNATIFRSLFCSFFFFFVFLHLTRLCCARIFTRFCIAYATSFRCLCNSI